MLSYVSFFRPASCSLDRPCFFFSRWQTAELAMFRSQVEQLKAELNSVNDKCQQLLEEKQVVVVKLTESEVCFLL